MSDETNDTPQDDSEEWCHTFDFTNDNGLSIGDFDGAVFTYDSESGWTVIVSRRRNWYLSELQQRYDERLN